MIVSSDKLITFFSIQFSLMITLSFAHGFTRILCFYAKHQTLATKIQTKISQECFIYLCTVDIIHIFAFTLKLLAIDGKKPSHKSKLAKPTLIA